MESTETKQKKHTTEDTVETVSSEKMLNLVKCLFSKAGVRYSRLGGPVSLHAFR